MSLKMAQKVIVPQKKNYVPQFLKQRDINSYLRAEKPSEDITQRLFLNMKGLNPYLWNLRKISEMFRDVKFQVGQGTQCSPPLTVLSGDIQSG
jgi:hypothetical protein